MAFKSRNISVSISGTRLLGVRSQSISITNELVDVTNESDESADGNLWRVLLAAAGNRVVTITGSGIFKDDAAIRLFQDFAASGDSVAMVIEFENGDTISGDFGVISLEYTGEQFGVQTYAVSLESALSASVSLTRYTAPLAWGLRTSFIASDASADSIFARSLSISSDGTILVAGAQPNAGSIGRAYTYDGSGSVWTNRNVTINLSTDAYGSFGIGTAISGNGLVLAVGAHLENSGRGGVYIYDWSGSAWTYRGKITPSDSQVNDFFGVSVALSTDGSSIAIGAIGRDDIINNCGKVYTYDWSGASWGLRATVTASDAGDTDYFGIGVDISGDGTVLVASAYLNDAVAQDAGKVYTYDWSGSAWTERNTLTASDAVAFGYFGVSVSISLDGNVLAVGTTVGNGKVYTYDISGSTWVERTIITAFDGVSDDAFGRGVSLSYDGSVLAVGAPHQSDAGHWAGKVYIYDYA